MTQLYQFQYAEMEFSKDGQLDELIALDRYVVPSYENYQVGDTVVAIIDTKMGTKKVGEIVSINDGIAKVKDRFGESHKVEIQHMHKPIELKPAQLWERWAKGASSVESDEKKQYWENEFRWLFDGYRYSPGGRIQLMLGQEFVTGQKANLTAFNCFVIPTAKGMNTALEQFLEVMRVASIEANIMRRGGGCGSNVSEIKTVKGSGRKKEFFKFYLPQDHKDSKELQDRSKLGKFDNVVLQSGEYVASSTLKVITVEDSVEGHFNAINEMIVSAFDDSVNHLMIDFRSIRERNAIVKGVNGRSSGAVSWMELFALVAELLQKDTVDNIEFAEIFSFIVHLIIQGGSRRG